MEPALYFQDMGFTDLRECKRVLLIARKAAERAYAPYSRYRVGAVVISDKGRIYSGVNVENASYGLTQCAERAAISAAVLAEGPHVSIRAVALHIARGAPVAPCGACRQVLHEFATDSAEIALASGESADTRTFRLADLLPDAFGAESFATEHSADDPALLHVYASERARNEAALLGNSAGLVALIGCLEAASEAGRASADLYCADGEAYGLVVIRHDGDWSYEGLPYTRARDERHDTIWPALIEGEPVRVRFSDKGSCDVVELGRPAATKQSHATLLHLHSPRHWHEEASIIGTSRALELLRLRALDALTSSIGELEALCADGNRYTLSLQRQDGGLSSPAWMHTAVPYTDDYAADRDRGKRRMTALSDGEEADANSGKPRARRRLPAIVTATPSSRRAASVLVLARCLRRDMNYAELIDELDRRCDRIGRTRVLQRLCCVTLEGFETHPYADDGANRARVDGLKTRAASVAGTPRDGSEQRAPRAATLDGNAPSSEWFMRALDDIERLLARIERPMGEDRMDDPGGSIWWASVRLLAGSARLAFGPGVAAEAVEEALWQTIARELAVRLVDSQNDSPSSADQHPGPATS